MRLWRVLDGSIFMNTCDEWLEDINFFQPWNYSGSDLRVDSHNFAKRVKLLPQAKVRGSKVGARCTPSTEIFEASRKHQQTLEIYATCKAQMRRGLHNL